MGDPLEAFVAESLLKLDGWINAVTGLGAAAYDKTVNALFAPRHRVQRDEHLEILYDEDPLARRICELLPDEMLSPGFDINLGDVEDAIDIKAELLDQIGELGAVSAIKTGMVWERVFGGGAVFVSVDDGVGDPAIPLDLDRVRTVTGLTPIDKRWIWARDWYAPTDRKAGQVEVWEVQPINGGPSVPIHETRLLIFPGGRVTQWRRIQLRGWGQSMLQSIEDVLADCELSWRGLTHMLQSANQDVWYMDGLKNALSANSETAKAYFAARFQMAQQRMGPNRAVTLDSKDEKFERFGSTLTGVPEAMEMIFQKLSAVTGYPITKLFGTSAKGMNATGAHDSNNWYATLSAKRAESPEPQLKRLVEILLAATEGPTKGAQIDRWSIKWHPFEQMNDIELAELRKTVAETDQIYVNMQSLLPEIVTKSRFRPEGWSMETDVDQDMIDAMLKAETERAMDQAEKPQPAPVVPAVAPPDGGNSPAPGETSNAPGQGGEPGVPGKTPEPFNGGS